MSLVLSSSQSSTLEPVRKNRFIYQFEEVPGNTGNDASKSLAFACHTSGIPKFTTEATETSRLHEKFHVANKPSWETLSASFYDYLNADKSAGQILYNWQTIIYNPVTGQMGYKTEYSTTSTLAQLDPHGAIFRMWNIFYIWPTSVTYGDSLDANADDVMNVEVEFRYDFAVKADDESVAPE